jgi:hypothetical protein
MISLLNFFGTSYVFSITGYGLGYNSILAAISEFITFVILSILFTILAIFIHKLPRKISISLFYIGVFAMGFLFFFDFATSERLYASLLMTIGRFFSSKLFF